MSPAHPEPDVLARAADILRRGGLVVFPTDTLYGLAADPRNAGAVARVYREKGRGRSRALPLIASDLRQVEAASGGLSPLTRRLAERFWPGPLTLVVEAAPGLPSRPRRFGDVAVRVPDQAVARGLASCMGFPITSTSANRSGAPAPRTADEAVIAIAGDVDLLLDGGPTPGGEPSTIVDAQGRRPRRLIRAGARAPSRASWRPCERRDAPPWSA